ncbi:MAG TPA: cytochrome b/b6 domain-containing protein [Microvirga sp.]|nr:cytochrome b/b6 domain-containing protein [Microvirga sp.]
MKPGTQTYSPAQKGAHWLTAALVALLIPAGYAMTGLMAAGSLKNAVYELHKSFGMMVFGLGLWRVGLRLWLGAPPTEPGLPAWQRAAARASHFALYALLLLVPLSGWAATSACCAPVNLFWSLPLTLPVEGGMERAKAIFLVHDVLAYSLAAVVALHAAAALHHHWVRRDGTLLRMWPGAKGAAPVAAAEGYGSSGAPAALSGGAAQKPSS